MRFNATNASTQPALSFVGLYVDEMQTAFFRRMAFTPDGSLFLTPAGRSRGDDGAETNAVYIFRTSMPDVPALRIRGMPSPVICVRCCPLFFKKRTQEGETSDFGKIVSGLEHRMVYAVATTDTVLFYDTEQLAPFAVVAHLHLATITDLAWSADAKFLCISSQDGYCSVVTFQKDELGEVSEARPPLLTDFQHPVIENAKVDKKSADGVSPVLEGTEMETKADGAAATASVPSAQPTQTVGRCRRTCAAATCRNALPFHRKRSSILCSADA